MVLQTLAAVVVVAVAVLFGYRLVQIDNRLDAIEKRLGGVHASDDSKHKPSSPPLEERLSELESKADQLSIGVGALQRVPHVAPTTLPPRPLDDKAILSVVEREQNKTRDAQLEWHRTHWLDAREGQLAAFSRQFNLTQGQTNELHRAFEKEIDSMVDLLKRPAMLQNPDEAMNEWGAVLADTDATAQHILNPTQMTIWTQERWLERKILWPGLPN